MMSRRIVAIVIALWTLISWGNRIGLLTDAEQSDVWNWTRIGGSIVVGLGTAVVFWVRPQWMRPAAWAFASLTTVIWLRSLVTVWSEPNTFGFRMVHTLLAVAWFALAAWSVKVAQAGSGTDSSMGSGVPGGTMADSRSTTSSTDR